MSDKNFLNVLNILNVLNSEHKPKKLGHFGRFFLFLFFSTFALFNFFSSRTNNSLFLQENGKAAEACVSPMNSFRFASRNPVPLEIESSPISETSSLEKNQTNLKTKEQTSTKKSNKNWNPIDSVALGASLGLESQLVFQNQSIKNALSDISERLESLGENSLSQEEREFFNQQGREYLDSFSERVKPVLEKKNYQSLYFCNYADNVQRVPDTESGICWKSNDPSLPITGLGRKAFRKKFGKQPGVDIDLEQKRILLFHKLNNLTRKNELEAIDGLLRNRILALSNQTKNLQENKSIRWETTLKPVSIVYTKATPLQLKGVCAYDFFKNEVLLGIGQNKVYSLSESKPHYGIVTGWYYGHGFQILPENRSCSYSGFGLHGFCGLGITF